MHIVQGGTPSLLEAYEDDEVLRKIIKNRILYSGVKIKNGKAFVTPETIVMGVKPSKKLLQRFHCLDQRWQGIWLKNIWVIENIFMMLFKVSWAGH